MNAFSNASLAISDVLYGLKLISEPSESFKLPAPKHHIHRNGDPFEDLIADLYDHVDEFYAQQISMSIEDVLSAANLTYIERLANEIQTNLIAFELGYDKDYEDTQAFIRDRMELLLIEIEKLQHTPLYQCVLAHYNAINARFTEACADYAQNINYSE